MEKSKARVTQAERWFRYPDDAQFEVKLRYVSSIELNRARRDCRPANAFDRNEVDQGALIQWFAEAVIKDWRGYTDGADVVPFTVTECVELLSENARLAMWVMTIVTDMAKFQGEEQATAETSS